MTTTQELQKNHIILFFLIAVVFTSLFWIPTLLIASEYILPSSATFLELTLSGFTDQTHIILSLIFALGVYGPLVAALIMLKREEGTSGIQNMFDSVKKWRLDSKWYLVVIILPFVLSGPAVILSVLVLVQYLL